jgi:hypothetical protein
VWWAAPIIAGMGAIVFAAALMLTTAVAAGWLADRRGYSFVLFAFLGLFFPIAGLIVALVLPAKHADATALNNSVAPPQTPPNTVSVFPPNVNV